MHTNSPSRGSRGVGKVPGILTVDNRVMSNDYESTKNSFTWLSASARDQRGALPHETRDRYTKVTDVTCTYGDPYSFVAVGLLSVPWVHGQ